MASDSTRCAVLMAIKPPFAHRLLSGTKQVEFRRRAAARKLTHIVVYATLPVAAVVGVLEIGELAEGTPNSLWRRFSEVGGIPRKDFFVYFSGTQTGVAYLVREAWSCGSVLKLGSAGLPSVAPQAHQYLNVNTIDRLQAQRTSGDGYAAPLDYQSWLAACCRGGASRSAR